MRSNTLKFLGISAAAMVALSANPALARHHHHHHHHHHRGHHGGHGNHPHHPKNTDRCTPEPQCHVDPHPHVPGAPTINQH